MMLCIFYDQCITKGTCAVLSRSLVFDSLGPHGLWPTRLLYPRGFSRQEYWSGLPFPSPGDLPNSEIEYASPAWQVDSLSLSHALTSEIQTENNQLGSFLSCIKKNYFYFLAVSLLSCRTWNLFLWITGSKAPAQ